MQQGIHWGIKGDQKDKGQGVKRGEKNTENKKMTLRFLIRYKIFVTKKILLFMSKYVFSLILGPCIFLDGASLISLLL